MKSLIRIGLFIVASLLVLLVLVFLKKQSSPSHSKYEDESKMEIKGQGFAVSLLFYEQIGNAASNLMNLQCWAGSLNMNVVEPFIRETRDKGDQVFFFNDFEATQSQSYFRDLFDIAHWNTYSTNRGYAPVVSANEFLVKAPRRLIYVTLLYSGSLNCPKSTNAWSEMSAFFERHRFETVRKVCVTLLHEGRVRTQQEFNKLIFGELLWQDNFTVVFDEWRAIRNESEREGKLDFMPIDSNWHRILVRDSLCTYGSLDLQPYHVIWERIEKNSFQPKQREVDVSNLKRKELGLIPNKQVLVNVDTFKERHMEGSAYIAVMARMEKYQITDHSLHADCVKKIASFKDYAFSKYELSRTFFSSDVGKYGSNSWNSQFTNKDLSVQLYQDIIKILGISSEQVDSSSQNFETVTHSTGRVTIAWTQGIVVAEARCIIFLGGGAFQSLVLNLHSALYKGDECFVYLDHHCTEFAKLGFP